MKEIEAKVADILTGYEVALNVGSDRGVEKGNEVVIYEVRQINDPDTRELLGSVRIRKISLKITSTQKKMSIAAVSSYQDQPNVGLASAALTRTRHVMTTDPNDAKRGKVIYVRRGDPVTVTISEPKDDEPPF